MMTGKGYNMIRLETDRLILRDWSIDDKYDLYEYAKSDLVGPNAGWKPHKSLEESQSIIEMFINDNDVFAIELKESKKVIGSIGIHKKEPDENIKDKKQLEVGYVLNPQYWGNGYIPEAVERVKIFCFKDLDLDLLWCAHYDFNNNSKRVIEKCGFIYQFTKEQRLNLLDGRLVNTRYYKIDNPFR